jgi:ribokinase
MDITLSIIVLGGVNIDFIIETESIADRGETKEGKSFSVTPGGKGANQAVAAARILSGRDTVDMIGLLGDDRYSKELRDYLESTGVRTNFLGTVKDAQSGVAMILIDDSGENSVNAVYGTNMLVDESYSVKAIDNLEVSRNDIFLVQQEISLQATEVAMAKVSSLGATVILDPAPSRKDSHRLLELANILTPNQHEAEDLTGITVSDLESAQAAASSLCSEYGGTVIVTLAELGAWVENEHISQIVPSFSVNPVATVGAGDAFNGGLAAALNLGSGILEAVRIGNATGALCVTRHGAQEAMPTREELEGFLS